MSKQLRFFRRFRMDLAPLIVMLVVAGIGTYLLTNSRAATPSVSSEAESGTLADGAVVQTDVAASGGQAVRFGQVGSCSGGQVGSPPDCIGAPPAPLESGRTAWNVSFDDEFTESSLDPTKLTPCFDWNSGGCTSSFNNGYEHYQASQVQLSNGIAHLVAQPLSPPLSASACYNGSCTYKSGMVATSRPLSSNPNYLYKFTYGYVEASLKPLNTQGFFAAFWMLPADTSYNYTYEIDILEQLGMPHPSDMEMHYSYNNRSMSYTPNGGGSAGGVNNNNGACASNLDYSQAFHRYGVDWEPDHVAFYIDGVKCGQFNGTAGGTISNVPMQIILDQMVSNDWERSAGVPLTNNTLTSDLQVDYLRVYQQS